MSLSRKIFSEVRISVDATGIRSDPHPQVRPFFHMLEAPSFYPTHFITGTRHSLGRGWNRLGISRPAIDLHESGTEYVVEAELPGVKRDNIEVRVGDNGQSITIEGRVLTRSIPFETKRTGVAQAQTTSEVQAPAPMSETPAPAPAPSSEMVQQSSSMFTRMVWLPHPVESKKVTAKLEDGVLTVRVPKATNETGSVKVNID